MTPFKHIQNSDNPTRLKINESNDCTVRALMSCLGIRYLTAHQIAASAGRKYRKGFWSTLLLTQAKADGYIKSFQETSTLNIGLQKVKSSDAPRRYGSPYPTLRGVMPLMEKGRYIVETRNHAFAVVDGVVYDGIKSRPLLRVVSIYEVTK